MAAAYATVANEGVWLRLHVVAKVGSIQRPAYAARRVSPNVARQVMAMMRDVVVEGTARRLHCPDTRWPARPEQRRSQMRAVATSKSDYVASFVGVVPATNPRIVVLVTIDEPRGAIWGGTVAAPAFADIARFALQYLEVPPDAPETLPARE